MPPVEDKLAFVLRNIKAYEEFKEMMRPHPACTSALDHIDEDAAGLKRILGRFGVEINLDVWMGMLIGSQAVCEDVELEEPPQRFQLAMASIAEDMLEVFTEEAASTFADITVEDFM